MEAATGELAEGTVAVGVELAIGFTKSGSPCSEIGPTPVLHET